MSLSWNQVILSVINHSVFHSWIKYRDVIRAVQNKISLWWWLKKTLKPETAPGSKQNFISSNLELLGQTKPKLWFFFCFFLSFSCKKNPNFDWIHVQKFVEVRPGVSCEHTHTHTLTVGLCQGPVVSQQLGNIYSPARGLTMWAEASTAASSSYLSQSP